MPNPTYQGFFQPKAAEQEPTVRRCRFCKRPLYYVPSSHNNSKIIGWCHLQPGAWLACPASEGKPVEAA